MIELSDNAFRAYQLAKRIACPWGLRRFVVGFPNDLRQRLSIFGRDARRAIMELERAELLKPVSGKKIVREIVSAVKNSFATRRQSVHEVVMVPDNEIEIITDAQGKSKKEKREPFSPLTIIQVAASNLDNRPQAKRIVSAAIGILEKNPLLQAEDSTKLITLRGKLEKLAIKENDANVKIALQAAIKFLKEILKTKPLAASQS